MEQNSKKDMMVTLAVLLVIVVIVAGAVVFAKKKNDNTTTTSNTPTSSETMSSSQNTGLPQESGSSNTQNATNGTYKDGAYTATGNYSTPDGPETITVNVTLKDGTVADASAQGSMSTHDSREYVKMFLNAYKSQVVGKSVNGLSLSRVSGSSLTSQGFNRALEQIRSQAQS